VEGRPEGEGIQAGSRRLRPPRHCPQVLKPPVESRAPPAMPPGTQRRTQRTSVLHAPPIACRPFKTATRCYTHYSVAVSRGRWRGTASPAFRAMPAAAVAPYVAREGRSVSFSSPERG